MKKEEREKTLPHIKKKSILHPVYLRFFAIRASTTTPIIQNKIDPNNKIPIPRKTHIHTSVKTEKIELST